MSGIPLNIDWQQILLHLFNFSILAGGLYFLLFKPVKDFMAKREAHYRDMDAAAAKKVEEADRLMADYQEKLRNADEEIRLEKAKANQALQKSIQQQLSGAKQEAEQILNEAQAAARRSQAQAVEDARQEIQALAAAATEKLVLQSGGDTFDQFLDLVEEGSGDGRE